MLESNKEEQKERCGNQLATETLENAENLTVLYQHHQLKLYVAFFSTEKSCSEEKQQHYRQERRLRSA